MQGNVQNRLIEDEMKDSYLTYAMSVIVARALPDVRDGLKPSQRRILVAMNDLGIGPRSKHRKCAKIAGDTSGNYHPHGEAVVYPTLVRMAQPFNMRYPLVDGQGNFGSVDGDPAAAMRYTEARMTVFAMEMLEDLKLDTVDYVPNYDETREEPSVLPSRFPNLLANGSGGIAVGMATSIPPHNLSEIADGIIHLVENPECAIQDLLKFVHGPDFPTGALICGRQGVRDAYTTGRGHVIVRARIHLEETKKKKRMLVVTEIPYQITKTRIIESIVEAVKTDRISGIRDVNDESDREGMRLVVELKQDAEEQVVLNQLYKHTPLQDTCGIIMIALVNGMPRTLNLKELMQEYVRHREQVIRRRTEHLLKKAEHEAHIREGLLKALDHIDEIIEIIRSSADVPDARRRLIERFQFSEIQADTILEMKLQRLTGLEREKVRAEYEELKKQIADYKMILADRNLILDIIKEDLHELKRKYTDPRRTEIVGEIGEFNAEDLIAEESVVVTISHDGYIKRMPLSAYRKQRRGGKGVTGAETKEQDFIEHLFVASTHDYILFFTNLGKVHWLKVYDIPQLSRTALGRALVNLISITQGELVRGLVRVRDFTKGYLLLATGKGVVKKTALSAYGNPKKGGIIALKLREGDNLIGANVTNGESDVILGTVNGQAIRFNEKELRPMGRPASGVRGARLRKDDSVCAMNIVDREAMLLSFCENGFGKRTPFDEYPVTRRGAIGVINIRASERNGKVVTMLPVRDGDNLITITEQGMVVRFSVDDVRPIGRATQGVRLIRLQEGDKVGSVAKIAREDIPEGDGEESCPAELPKTSVPGEHAENGAVEPAEDEIEEEPENEIEEETEEDEIVEEGASEEEGDEEKEESSGEDWEDEE
jgi:DNA gyrase subunit A